MMFKINDKFDISQNRVVIGKGGLFSVDFWINIFQVEMGKIGSKDRGIRLKSRANRSCTKQDCRSEAQRILSSPRRY